MESSNNLNLVWFEDKSPAWGRSWIELLTKNTKINYHYSKSKKDTGLLDNCIVVTNNSESYDYIKALDSAGKKFAVILICDETLEEPMFYLESNNCMYAARNYFSPFYWQHPKVFTFGLGYKHNFEKFTNAEVPSSKRRFTWSFTGSLKVDRAQALSQFCELVPHQISIFKNFDDPRGLTKIEYAKLLSDSAFCPAPRGGANIDSFRIYEALEAGSIPVVLKSTEELLIEPSYWHAVFLGAQELPFVCANNWPEAIAECKKIIQENRIDQVQEECLVFWESWKTNWKDTFAEKNKLFKRIL